MFYMAGYFLDFGDPIFCLGGNGKIPVSPEAAKERGYVLDDNLMELLTKSNDIFHCISIEEVEKMIFGDSRSDSENSEDESDEDLPF